MAWYKVADVVDHQDAVIKKVSAGGKNICLVYDSGEWFAVAVKCPHAGADLSNGWCSNGNLVCPFHRYEYDLHTGRGAPGQNDYVRTYATEVRSDGIYVEVRSWLEAFTKG